MSCGWDFANISRRKTLRNTMPPVALFVIGRKQYILIWFRIDMSHHITQAGCVHLKCLVQWGYHVRVLMILITTCIHLHFGNDRHTEAVASEIADNYNCKTKTSSDLPTSRLYSTYLPLSWQTVFTVNMPLFPTQFLFRPAVSPLLRSRRFSTV